MSTEQAVAAHYTTDGLMDRILAAMRESGLDPDALKPSDLRQFEHMHTGGLAATRRVIATLALGPGDHVVDIGCGIGGTARELAVGTGARVTGIDLTPALVAVATELSHRTGIGRQTVFREGSALSLPLGDAVADAVVTLHAGMNIDDKAGLFAEAVRVLKPGGRFAICDVMLGEVAEPLAYPVPWAESEATSFLAAPATYRALAAEAGLIPVLEEDYYTETLQRPIAPGEPRFEPLGAHLMMGADAAAKVTNHRANLEAGRVIPVLMVFDKPGGGR